MVAGSGKIKNDSTPLWDPCNQSPHAALPGLRQDRRIKVA
jgi:hypothetical protein